MGVTMKKDVAWAPLGRCSSLGTSRNDQRRRERAFS